MSKPREFYLKDIDVCYTVFKTYDEANNPKIRLGKGETIHVIEYSAYETLTAKVKRYEEVFNKEFFLNIITEWKFSWMNQRQNDQKDYENYHRRAFGVDANMKHDLASRLARAALNQGED